MNIIFLGPAGSGKTSLCKNYGSWLKTVRNESVSFVNLDAGANFLPYSPDFDIRRYFTLTEIMKHDELGPNGAMLRANELLLERSDQILPEISSLKSDFILIDTPGQLEPFVFKETGSMFLQKLHSKSPTIGIFLIDAELTISASKLIVGLLIAIAVQIQLEIEMVYILHKADLLSHDSNVIRMVQDPQYLKDCIRREQRGAITDLALIAQEAFAELAPSMRVISTSVIKENYGLIEMHDLIHETFCACGDTT